MTNFLELDASIKASEVAQPFESSNYITNLTHINLMSQSL
jgi:hypothetical protein